MEEGRVYTEGAEGKIPVSILHRARRVEADLREIQRPQDFSGRIHATGKAAADRQCPCARGPCGAGLDKAKGGSGARERSGVE